MQLPVRDPAYLYDMARAAEKVARYVHGRTLEHYCADELLRDAVTRNIEIIGEAARRISQPFKDAHPEIPWRRIIAQRNVLVHEYDAVSDQELWEVATVHLPRLLAAIVPLIPTTLPAN